MVGTLFSVVAALLLYFEYLPEEIVKNAAYMAVVMFIVAALFVATQTAITLFCWTPLQKLEQNLTPRVMQVFRKDRNLRLTQACLFGFLFFTYFVIADALFLRLFRLEALFALWTILLGISVDLLHHHLKRVMEFLDPYHVVQFFRNSAQKSIRETKEIELCDWIDSFGEMAVKGMRKGGTSIAVQAIENLEECAKTYLAVAKGITYHADADRGKFGGADHVSYILLYLFQRFELIFYKGLEQHFEPVCSKVIVVLGKICLYCAKYDISVATYPLFYLEKLTSLAQEAGMQEVGNRAASTLVEVGRAIVKEVDLNYVEIRNFFTTLVNSLHIISKNTFRGDKSSNIKMLMHPFNELRGLFQQEKIAGHQDTPAIVSRIDAAIGEFATLETVMSTMPPFSEIMKEREAGPSNP